MKCAEKYRFCWDTKVDGTKGGKHGSKVSITWHDNKHKAYERRLMTRSGQYHLPPSQHRELWGWFKKTFIKPFKKHVIKPFKKHVIRPIANTVKSVKNVLNGSAIKAQAFEKVHPGIECDTVLWPIPVNLSYIKLYIDGDNAILIDEAVLEKVNFLGELIGGKGKQVSKTISRFKDASGAKLEKFMDKMEDSKALERWGKGGDKESDRKGFCVSSNQRDYEKSHIFAKGWDRNKRYAHWCDRELRFYVGSQKVWGNKNKLIDNKQWKAWKRDNSDCVADSDCLSRRCSFKICRKKNSSRDKEKCKVDEDCQSNYCSAEKCQTKYSGHTNHKCSHDHDCKSKKCSTLKKRCLK
jgi:hypothetical protein